MGYYSLLTHHKKTPKSTAIFCGCLGIFQPDRLVTSNLWALSMFASQQFRSPGAMGGFPPAGRWRGLGLPSLKLTALAPEKIAFPQKEMHLPTR